MLIRRIKPKTDSSTNRVKRAKEKKGEKIVETIIKHPHKTIKVRNSSKTNTNKIELKLKKRKVTRVQNEKRIRNEPICLVKKTSAEQTRVKDRKV